MNYTVRIQGDALGPFNIYYDTASAGTELVASASRESLLSGLIVEGAPPNASSIVVYNSDPDCQNYVIYSIPPSPTPSATPSVTPSVTPSTPLLDCDLSGSAIVSPSPTPTPTSTPSVTPSITSTPSVTPSKTPSVTPSNSPATITATIDVSADTRQSAPNAGWLLFYAQVTLGSTQDNLTFTGTFERYTNSNCTSAIAGGCSFSNEQLLSGNISLKSGILCDYVGVGGNSVKLLSLSINGTNITSNNQVITVSGRSYRITGFGDCISGI